MKLSFSIPAHNEEILLSKCLDSILLEIKEEIKSNNLDSKNIEVIVVNNNSIDNTKELAISYIEKFKNINVEMKVIDEERKGLLFARETGFINSDGDIVANVDSDAHLKKGWLAKVINEFEKDKDLVALSGPQIYYDSASYERILAKIFYFPGYIYHILSLKLTKKGKMLQGGNFIIKRDAWKKAGGFDTNIEFYGEDTDVVKRIAKYGKVIWTWNLPINASGRRLKKEGIIKTGFTYAINFLSVSFFSKPITKKYKDHR